MSEHDIQSEIIKYLKPRLAWVARFNSGMVMASYRGKKRFIRYNFLDGCPDIMGQTKNGRHVSIEVKGEDWKPSNGTGKKAIRERKQKAHVDLVNENGGIGLIAKSLEEVMERIEKL